MSTLGTPLWIRIWMGLGAAFPFVGGVLAATLGDDGAFRLGGLGIALAVPLAVYSRRISADASAPTRAVDGGIALPRRPGHGLALAGTCAALALGTGGLATADRQADRIGSTFRGDPEVMILFAPPLAVAALLLAGGVLLGRGRLHIGTHGVAYSRIARTTRRTSWEDLRGARLVDNDTVLRVDRRKGHIRVPLAGQRWPGPVLLETLARHHRAATEARAAGTDPGALA